MRRTKLALNHLRIHVNRPLKNMFVYNLEEAPKKRNQFNLHSTYIHTYTVPVIHSESEQPFVRELYTREYLPFVQLKIEKIVAPWRRRMKTTSNGLRRGYQRAKRDRERVRGNKGEGGKKDRMGGREREIEGTKGTTCNHLYTGTYLLVFTDRG